MSKPVNLVLFIRYLFFIFYTECLLWYSSYWGCFLTFIGKDKNFLGNLLRTQLGGNIRAIILKWNLIQFNTDTLITCESSFYCRIMSWLSFYENFLRLSRDLPPLDVKLADKGEIVLEKVADFMGSQLALQQFYVFNCNQKINSCYKYKVFPTQCLYTIFEL